MTALLVSPLDTIGSSMTDLRMAKTADEYVKCSLFCNNKGLSVVSLLSMSGFIRRNTYLPAKDIRNLVLDPSWRKSMSDQVDGFLGSISDGKDRIVLLLPTCTLSSSLVDDIRTRAFRALVPVRRIEDYFGTTSEPFSLSREEVSALSERMEKKFFERFANPTKSRERGEIRK